MSNTTIKSGIYLIRNLINGKKYVGSTGSSQGFNKRWRDHKKDLKGNYHDNQYLQNAFNKYGESNFEWIILEECSDYELILREQAWINYNDSMNPKYGYNLVSADRYVFSKEAIKNISDGLLEYYKTHDGPNKGIKLSQETKEKMRKSKLEYFETHDGFTLGIKTSPETKEKISKTLTGLKKSDSHKENISKGLTGIHKSDLHKKNLSKSLVGHIIADETKEKMRKSHIGKKHSDKTKQKMSEAAKKYQLAKLNSGSTNA